MPLTADQKELLNSAFRPHAPIEDPTSFAGRQSERERVMDAIDQPGLQVVIFGEHGAGKTSLANVCTADRRRVRLFCEEQSTFQMLCKNILLEYKPLAPMTFKFDAVKDTIEIEGGLFPLEGLTGNQLRQILPDEPLCIVLDELDRLKSDEVLRSLAELAKNFSTYKQKVTLIMIGVAATADELLAGHASNVRNLRQVSLDRMREEDLRAIIGRGESILSVVVEPEVKDRIIQMCDRLPYYLHLLASNAAKIALNRGSTSVEMTDLMAGVRAAAQDADQTLRKVYDHAILAKRGSHIYRQVLWAMAVMAGPAHTVSEVANQSNKIAVAEGGRPVTVQAVGQALNKFVSAEKKYMVVSYAT
jgi:hypothetical protein